MSDFDPDPYLRRIARRAIEPGRRIRTRALLIAKDGQEYELSSGSGDRYFAHAVQLARRAGFVGKNEFPEFAAHVEMKAAIWMQLHERRDVTLVTNSATCVGPLSCVTALSSEPPTWCRQRADPAAMPTVIAYFRREHERTPIVFSDSGDVACFLDELASQPFENSLAALYVRDRRRNTIGLPDHELRIGVDGATSTAALRYMGNGGTWYSEGRRSLRDELCFYYMGNESSFPINSEVPLETAAETIREFLAKNGDRPENIAWSPFELRRPLTGEEHTQAWWKQ